MTTTDHTAASLSGIQPNRIGRTDSTFSYATSMASRYSNDPHSVLLSPPPDIDVTISAHASDVLWPMNMGTRQQIELAKARNATVSALRGMRKLESEVKALKGRLEDLEVEKALNEQSLRDEIERLKVGEDTMILDDNAGDDDIPDEGSSTISVIKQEDDNRRSIDEEGSKRFFDQAMDQTLESARREGDSNRFMMGPPEGQSVTLEMANRALANGCKKRDEEIARLRAELDRVTNELNELRTKERMQKSDKGESSSEVESAEDTKEVKKDAKGETVDWKTVVRSTAGDEAENAEQSATAQNTAAKANTKKQKWYKKLLCYSSSVEDPAKVKPVAGADRPSTPPVLSARTEAGTSAPHSP